MRENERADYLVFNDNFDEALYELKAIITCHRLGQKRQALAHKAVLEGLTR